MSFRISTLARNCIAYRNHNSAEAGRVRLWRNYQQVSRSEIKAGAMLAATERARPGRPRDAQERRGGVERVTADISEAWADRGTLCLGGSIPSNSEQVERSPSDLFRARCDVTAGVVDQRKGDGRE
jgi:hypothetical protein